MCECKSINATKRINVSFERKEELESLFITNVAKEASINAIQDTFNHGMPVTTIQGDSIVKKYQDGSIDFVQKIEKMSIIPKRRIYHL